MHWHAAVLQAGQRGDLSAVLGVVESAGKDFDTPAVEAALAQVSCTLASELIGLPHELAV